MQCLEICSGILLKSQSPLLQTEPTNRMVIIIIIHLFYIAASEISQRRPGIWECGPQTPKEMFPQVQLKVSVEKMSVLEQWDCPNGPDCFIVLSIREAVRDNELYYALLSLPRVEARVCVHCVVDTHSGLNAVICLTRRVAAALTLSLCWSCSAVWLHCLDSLPIRSQPCFEAVPWAADDATNGWRNAASEFREREFCAGRERDVREFRNPSVCLPQRRIRRCRGGRWVQAEDRLGWRSSGTSKPEAFTISIPQSHPDALWCVQRERESRGREACFSL